ncbi:MAG: VIT1/CCC1 transporter family protein [Candidatus Hadarchaeota archaeon]|nr:VIT1/CCC1 transporter family protein [Candidatus Hadarchaeota archaeon]
MNRYLIRGLIDGSLSTLGIVIGASTAIGLSSEAARIIVSAGIGGGVANGISNLVGAFAAEKTVAHKNMERVERAMLKRDAIRNSELYEETERRIISSGVVDALATIGGSLIPVVPFFVLFVTPLLTSPLLALGWSAAITFALFFFLGIYIGRVSRENLALSGLKMVLFAGATAAISALIKIVM